MSWIGSLIVLIGVALGWVLNEASKYWLEKKGDKKKLKKLLFYLLELRYTLSQENNRKKEIKEIVSLFFDKLKIQFNISEKEINSVELEHLFQYLNQLKPVDKRKIHYLENNIDEVIIELAEIYPIFAYELNGQHRIKEKLKDIDNYFLDFENQIKELPFNLKEWVMIKVDTKIFRDLDEKILRIAKTIDSKTKAETESKIKIQDEIDIEDLKELLEEYLNKIDIEANKAQ